MANLEITDEKARKIDEVETGALEIVGDVMRDKRDVDDVAKAAIKVLAITAKNRQTLTARTAISFHIAEQFAKDENELRRYIAVTNPQIVKALK